MGKLTVYELIELEKTYGDIFQTDILEYTFYWRELTQEEYDRASRLLNNEEEVDEYICKVCVVKPDFDFTKCYAGIPNTLSRAILNQSGFVEGYGKEMLEIHRMQVANNFENQIAPIICTAFPTLDLEQVEGWPVSKQVRYLAKAEWVLKNIHGIPLTIGEEQSQRPDYDDFPELQPRKK
jgi:hypothetical protein